MKDEISLGRVLSEVNSPNALFDLTYRKVDGTMGMKQGCTRLATSNALSERKKMNRSGLLKLFHRATGRTFEVYIDLLVQFNGLNIDHER